MRGEMMIRERALYYLILLAVGVSAGGWGCAKPRSPTTTTPVDRAQMIELFAKRRHAREQQLHQMSVLQLVHELQVESDQGIEPFNSMASKEVTARGAPVAVELRQSIINTDQWSLLALVALRKLDLNQYNMLDQHRRALVLVTALRNSKTFNTWGIPHLRWEDAAVALIVDRDAVRADLIDMLKDNRPAPMWGTEAASEQSAYGYRVSDYGLTVMTSVNAQPVSVPQSAKQRDKLIERLLAASTP
jgi:hypothetical protein